MWYNSNCHANSFTGRFVFLKLPLSAIVHCGQSALHDWYQVRPGCSRDNGSAIREGHFAMIERYCLDCGIILTGHNKSIRCRSCAARERYIQRYGKPPERIVAKCAVCDKEFSDYASNRRKSKFGVYFCSYECRAAWTGVHNSILHGGDGKQKSKSDKDKFYYRENAAVVRVYARKYYADNREKILAEKRIKTRALKKVIIDAYGGKCECCGEPYFEFLTIDHTNGDGAEHRRRIGKGGTKLYKAIIAEGFPKDRYRLLCFNCNIALGFYGYCPHHPENKSGVSHKPFNPGRKRTVV